MNQLTPQDLAHLRAKVSELDADGNFKNEHGNPNNCILKLLDHIDTQGREILGANSRIETASTIIAAKDKAMHAAIDRAEKADIVIMRHSEMIVNLNADRDAWKDRAMQAEAMLAERSKQ